MKICMLGDAPSSHLQHMAGGLARRGLEIHIITHKPVEIEGVSLEKFSVPPFGWRYMAPWSKRRIQHLRRIMRRFDVVHIHFLHDWGMTPEIASEGNLVVTPWGSDIVHPPDTPPSEPELLRVRRRLLRTAKCVTAWGPTFARAVADFADLDPNRIRIVPLSVDTELFAPQPPSFPPCQGGTKGGCDTPVIGYFKGFAPVYGPLIMVEAAARVVGRRPEVRFEFVGDGALLDAARRRVDELRIGHAIRWRSHQPHDALPSIMAGWDIVAISSRRESFGLAALEASAMGLPVVATDVGGLHETVLHEETGLLVAPEDPQALADGLLTLLGDPQRRRAMGATGRRMVIERFGRDRVLDSWVDLYEHTIRSTASSAGVAPVHV
ncbi:MAG: glycosyltransferase family 4 protein [Planctomycetes bacterium]|nr:glycosyltransferase family 4 protein [Planctomycetota bacterium]